MKLFVLKLLSLLVLLTGLVMLGIGMNLAEVIAQVEQVRVFLAVEPGAFNLKVLVLGGVLTILGGYALLPQLKHRGTISYTGEHGEVNIQVDKAEATLKRVVTAMPEVKSVKVQVTPTKDRQRAVITADAVVHNQPDLPARDTFDLINHLIEETATDVLGLEIERPIHLKITGTDVDAKAASDALHERVARGERGPRRSVAPVGAAALGGAGAAGAVESSAPMAQAEVAAESMPEPEPMAVAPGEWPESETAPGHSQTPTPILQEQEHQDVASEEMEEALFEEVSAPHVVESPEVGVGPAVLDVEDAIADRREPDAPEPGEPGELRLADDVPPAEPVHGLGEVADAQQGRDFDAVPAEEAEEGDETIYSSLSEDSESNVEQTQETSLQDEEEKKNPW